MVSTLAINQTYNYTCKYAFNTCINGPVVRLICMTGYIIELSGYIFKKTTYFKFKKEEMIKNVFFDSVPYGYAIFDMILILLIY